MMNNETEKKIINIKDLLINIVVGIALAVILFFVLKECTKVKCDICDKKATKVLDAVITYNLCDEHYMWMTGGSSSSYSDSSYKGYSKTKGYNGSYRFRCTKQCDEECGNGCKSCVRDGTKCKFSYKASNDIGWIGCPDCGDVTHEEWYDWYEKALNGN